jgi:hypothetical protein
MIARPGSAITGNGRRTIVSVSSNRRGPPGGDRILGCSPTAEPDQRRVVEIEPVAATDDCRTCSRRSDRVAGVRSDLGVVRAYFSGVSPSAGARM